ncbi:MAG: delta-60 repeat domain-containing protein [Flavobacteriales bacterium]|nr:delta-60 repeat domain-containing protein [Flavobacteriales bacterium]
MASPISLLATIVYADGAVASGQHLLSDSTRGFVGFYDLIWFSNTGYLDTTKVHRQSNGIMWEFKELPDGKFICSCSCTQYEGQPVDKVFRVYPDGTLDTTFHTGINMGNIYAYHPCPMAAYCWAAACRLVTNCYSWWLLPDGS